MDTDKGKASGCQDGAVPELSEGFRDGALSAVSFQRSQLEIQRMVLGLAGFCRPSDA